MLAGSDAAIGRHDGKVLSRMWLWLGLLGLVWGLLLAGLWALAAQIFPWWWWGSNLPLMPVAVIVAVLGLSPMRHVLAAPARLLREDAAGQAVVAGATVCALAMGLLSILPYHRQAIGLPAWLAWTRPMAEYRVLILMPMWGVWAMMTPGHFCKLAETASPLVRGFCKGQPVLATAMWMAVPLAGTLWELNYLGQWVALPAGLALLAGGVGGYVICRRGGGLDRWGLLASNLLAQVAMLAGYLAAKTHA